MVKPNFEDMQVEIADLKEQLFLKKSTIAGFEKKLEDIKHESFAIIKHQVEIKTKELKG